MKNKRLSITVSIDQEATPSGYESWKENSPEHLQKILNGIREVYAVHKQLPNIGDTVCADDRNIMVFTNRTWYFEPGRGNGLHFMIALLP
jgi:hypothetical protein